MRSRKVKAFLAGNVLGITLFAGGMMVAPKAAQACETVSMWCIVCLSCGGEIVPGSCHINPASCEPI